MPLEVTPTIYFLIFCNQ